MRSRTVSRPEACWRSTRSGPPILRASSSRRRSSSSSGCQLIGGGSVPGRRARAAAWARGARRVGSHAYCGGVGCCVMSRPGHLWAVARYLHPGGVELFIYG